MKGRKGFIPGSFGRIRVDDIPSATHTHDDSIKAFAGDIVRHCKLNKTGEVEQVWRNWLPGIDRYYVSTWGWVDGRDLDYVD